ncbi:MAG: class I SAM-dependent methyltransferase family protein [Candidatus Micrarchaeales archaeon]|nr:class I SAM-dependent methyltransferase family protein [Candidatus Micrarchaeales archaeon]
MQYVRVNESSAEKIKRKLLRSALFDSNRSVKHSPSYVYFPILSISRNRIKKLLEGSGASLVEGKPERTLQKRKSYSDMLKEVTTKKQYESMSRSYDILGNIAIIAKRDKLMGKEKELARVIMRIHPNVKTVVAKGGGISGKFRTREFSHVLGKRNFNAVYKENGCIFGFDVRKAFFSNRLAFERSRITRLVKEKEKVAVLFAGVGPFAIEIAKMHPKASVLAVELNPHAYDMMKENIALNKVKNVTAVKGDVNRIPRKFYRFADRIVVPMPTASTAFLDSIFRIAKRTAVVHLYSFVKLESMSSDVTKRIQEHAKKNNYRAKVLFTRKVTPYSHGDIEMVVDYRITKK